jgi:Protein of unknown function (DUF3592)
MLRSLFRSLELALATVFMVALLVVHLLCTIATVQSLRSHWWPTAPGVVTSSEVVDGLDGGRYRWHFAYEYSVGENTYTSTRFYDRGTPVTMRSRRQAEGRSQQYPIGASIVVTYDPENIASARITRGVDHGGPSLSWILVFVHLFLVVWFANVWDHFHHGSNFDPLNPHTVERCEGCIRVRLPRANTEAPLLWSGYGWFAGMLTYLLVGTIVMSSPENRSAFVVELFFLSAGYVIGIALTSIQFVALWQVIVRPVMEIDHVRNVVRWDRRWPWETPRCIAIAGIESIASVAAPVMVIRGKPTTRHDVQLLTATGQITLTSCDAAGDADFVATWLATHVRHRCQLDP